LDSGSQVKCQNLAVLWSWALKALWSVRHEAADLTTGCCSLLGGWTAFWLDEGFRVSGTSMKPTEHYSLDKKTQWKLNWLLLAKFSFSKISEVPFTIIHLKRFPLKFYVHSGFIIPQRERETHTHTHTHNQQWGRKTRKNSQWEIPNTDLLSKLRKYMYIIFECTQQLIFMCKVPRFHRFVLFVIITHVGVFFSLLLYPFWF
jgi:hypothetical protein